MNIAKKSAVEILSAILFATALALVPIGAQSASAGEYVTTTNFCDWDFAADGYSFGIMGGCNQGYVIVEQTGHTPVGTFQWWRSNALPPTLNLNSVVYNSSWDNGNPSGDGFPFETRMCSANPYGSGSSPCSGMAIDKWNSGHSGTMTDRANACPATMTAPGQAQICKGFIYGRFSSGAVTLGGSQLSNVRMTIADYTAPIVSTTLANYAISQGNWLRGTVSTGASATDSGGSGLASMSLVVLDDLPHSVSSTKSCYYGALIPCSTSSSFASSFNTTTVSDGAHSARYAATDAGSMTGTTSSFAFKVDNTKPDTPASVVVDVDGQQGWTSGNSIGAHWTNGAEELETSTQSGISAVVVDVNPTDSAQSDPAPITVPVGSTVAGISATRNSVSGVSLPAAGAYTLRLQLVDKAGNVSDVGDGSAGGVDSDVSVGYDPSAPGAPSGQANGWISRDELAAGYDQEFTYLSPPASVAPVCGYAATVDEDAAGTTENSINVPGGAGATTWRLPGALSEATHWVHLRAVSCNGLVTAQANTNHIEAKVDRTDPVGSIIGVEDGKWYKSGKQVTLSASDALSGMGAADVGDDDATHGAYLSYTLNGIGPLPKNSPRGDHATVDVAGEGQKELHFSPVDFAGNRAAATIATFGIDATTPIGFVRRQDHEHPTLLSAELGDVPSGVSYAQFAIRESGTDGNWTTLPTSLTGVDGPAAGQSLGSGVATARFPDTDEPAGTYDVRVSAFDQAGNELTTNQYKDGSSATVENPMRRHSALSLKVFKALRTCTRKARNGKKVKCVVKKCTSRSKGTCYKVLRGKVVLIGGANSVTSEFKRGAVAAGVLSDENGRPLVGAQLTVSTTEKFSGKKAVVGRVTTDASGLYSLRIPAGVSRTVTVTYDGTETRRPVSVDANMLTRAKVILKISRKRASTGQTVTFRGRVTAFDSVIPTGGKIVALEFYAARKWRPAVGVAHTDSKGRFSIKYKFDGARVRAKIIFRVAAPSEDGWGHTSSYSKTRVIRLNY